MALIIEYAPGATPLDPDEAAGLIPTGISSRQQLDEYEAANIAAGMSWAASTRRDILSEDFIYELHKKMFGQVWRWAGAPRKSEKNIGIAPHEIRAALKDLVEDVRTQVKSGEMSRQEIALRFHHRLTKIHAFSNGNGRHARLMTDLLLEKLGAKTFTWGAGDLLHEGEVRERYVSALRKADQKDYEPLRKFLCPDSETRAD